MPVVEEARLVARTRGVYIDFDGRLLVAEEVGKEGGAVGVVLVALYDADVPCDIEEADAALDGLVRVQPALECSQNASPK